MNAIRDIISVVSVALYHICKVYFMFMGIYYIYAAWTNHLDTFANITGIAGLLFLLSNIYWYFLKK